jgi:hypothetical protein
MTLQRPSAAALPSRSSPRGSGSAFELIYSIFGSIKKLQIARNFLHFAKKSAPHPYILTSKNTHTLRVYYLDDLQIFFYSKEEKSVIPFIGRYFYWPSLCSRTSVATAAFR